MTKVVKKRKIPVECDTMLWDGTADSAGAILSWVYSHKGVGSYYAPVPKEYNYADEEIPARLMIRTLEGPVYTNPGALIVKGVDDEFWPVADGIWQRTYEDVVGETPVRPEEEGREWAWVGAAKNQVMDVLEKHFDEKMIDPYESREGEFDLIGMADKIVEKLLDAGVKIPEDIHDPFQVLVA